MPIQLRDRYGDRDRGGTGGAAGEAIPGKQTLTGALQMRATGASAVGADETQAIAAEGVSGAGGGLPFAETIAQSFGPVHADTVHGIRAHTGDHATAAANDIGASAYATGNDVAFAGGADLHTAAHEAAHVVQQQQGVHLKGGVGEAGDPYEQHADAVADRVVRGESAASLLPISAASADPDVVAVQRKPKVDEGAVDPIDATPAASAPAPAAGTTAASASHDTVPTDWFVDFWGAGKNGKQAGRGDRATDDAIMLEDLMIGPKNHPKTFKKAGNALKSGYAPLGRFDHPKGGGDATGAVQYAKRKEIKAQVDWDGKKKGDKNNKVAEDAAQQAVEALIFQHTDLAGDWTAVEGQAAQAATAAAAKAGHGLSNVTVKISATGAHEQHSLDTVSYQVDKPANATAEIRVPTTTTTGTWSRSDTTDHHKNDATVKVQGGSVDGEVGGSSGHVDGNVGGHVGVKTDDKTKVDVSHDSKSTRTYHDYGVTYDEIENAATHISDTIITSLDATWEKILKDLSTGKEPRVKAESEHDLSLGDKVKHWFKERGKDVVNFVSDKVVDKVKSLVSGKIKGWVMTVVDAEEWWFPIAEWGIEHVVDWGAGKIKSKLHIDRGKGEKDPDPQHSQYNAQNSMKPHELVHLISQTVRSSDVKTESQKHTTSYVHDVFEQYESSSKDKVDVQHKTDNQVDANAHGSGNTSEVHGNVKAHVEGGSRTDGDEGGGGSTTRTYSGTTINVVAGHPILDIKIEDQAG